jgi:hypothetical protein
LETGQGVPADYRQRLLREYQRWELVNQQIASLEEEQQRRVATQSAKAMDKVRKRGPEGRRLNSGRAVSEETAYSKHSAAPRACG